MSNEATELAASQTADEIAEGISLVQQEKNSRRDQMLGNVTELPPAPPPVIPFTDEERELVKWLEANPQAQRLLPELKPEDSEDAEQRNLELIRQLRASHESAQALQGVGPVLSDAEAQVAYAESIADFHRALNEPGDAVSEILAIGRQLVETVGIHDLDRIQGFSEELAAYDSHLALDFIRDTEATRAEQEQHAEGMATLAAIMGNARIQAEQDALQRQSMAAAGDQWAHLVKAYPGLGEDEFGDFDEQLMAERVFAEVGDRRTEKLFQKFALPAESFIEFAARSLAEKIDSARREIEGDNIVNAGHRTTTSEFLKRPLAAASIDDAIRGMRLENLPPPVKRDFKTEVNDYFDNLLPEHNKVSDAPGLKSLIAKQNEAVREERERKLGWR